MKRTIIFLVCFLCAAPFALAEENEIPTDQAAGTAFQAREQQRTRFQERIDKEETPAYLRVMQQHQFKHQNTLRIQNMIQEAQKKGLPTEPMQNKVHEGIAKNAGEEAIVQAVARVQNRYENAYRHAQELFDDPEHVRSIGNRLAEAHAAGLTNEDTARIMEQLQQRLRNMNREHGLELAEATVSGARNMARRGVTSGTVFAVYGNALQHGYQAKDMQTMQQSFTNQARHGKPENIAHGFSQGIDQGLRAGGLGRSGYGSGGARSGETGSGGARGAGAGSTGAGVHHGRGGH